MNNRETEELITEFMGAELRLISKYDFNWGWLIPVAHKIITEFPQYDDSEEMQKVLEVGMTYNIEEVYGAVINFIKWYNTQKDGKTAKSNSRQTY